MERLDPRLLARYDCLFLDPHGDDAMLACPARMQAEVEKGRRVLLLALFEPVGSSPKRPDAARSLGADYAAAGLPSGSRRRGADAEPAAEPAGEREAVLFEAVRLLAGTVPSTQAAHIFAPLGLGTSADHLVTYEAALRVFATERGRNLFLYEERPEAFVPGAVRTRLALLGTRLPPAAQHAAEPASLWRHLLHATEPGRLRGERRRLREELAAVSLARRSFREARRWNPSRALGPRMQPMVHVADEQAMHRARAVAEKLLPLDGHGRPRPAERFSARAAAAARKLGGVYHAERLWLFLPSGDGLPETQHPLELAR
jgi:hypothetical protein